MRLPFAIVAVCAAISLHAQQPLRLAGSTTVKGMLEPHATALQKETGCPLEFSGTGSVAGLLSLGAGSADIAMLSLPLEDAVAAVNQKTPGRIDAARLWAERIGDMRTVFIVNPRNPVRSLTRAQLAGVLRGTIVNWKDVGGADAPVLVVSLGNGGSLLDQLLEGRSVTPSARKVSNATQIAVAVAQEPTAIGIINAAHPRGQTTVLQTDVVISTPLLLVTVGKPQGALQKLVDSARSLLAPTS